MNRYLIKVLMSICIMGIMLSGSIVGAEENATTNATESVTVTATVQYHQRKNQPLSQLRQSSG